MDTEGQWLGDGVNSLIESLRKRQHEIRFLTDFGARMLC